MRPDKDRYYLSIAREVAKRSTCLRRAYGAVIVNNDEIVATGYNGAPRGCASCDELGACRRRNHEHNDGDYRDCPAVHAEMNAMLSASRSEMKGAVMYLAGYDRANSADIRNATPCPICQRLILNAGIRSVVSCQADASERNAQ